MSFTTDSTNMMRSLRNFFCSYPVGRRTCCQKQWIDTLQHFLLYFFSKVSLEFFWICPENLSKAEEPDYHQCKRPFLLFYLREKCFLYASPLMYALL